MTNELRIIISGGGTGGHIFPAVSIANAIRACYPEAKILFVGAEGRMEMQRVPAAGYEIVGLPVYGFDRKRLLRNVRVVCKLLQSQLKARRIIRRFRPQVVVGVGGYASGPTLSMAGMMGIPTLIQEQNSYAGVTNKLLSRQAKKICVAYYGMERFFDYRKIVLTGNPVRQDLLERKIPRDEAVRSFGLDPKKNTVLLMGGSLGARTLNESMLAHLDDICRSSVQFIWQTGKYYFDEVSRRVAEAGDLPMIYVADFISKMENAYSAADLVISRAGAGSISEFCLLGKPVILVPSPNVAEDHQTKNASALVDKDAAICVKDSAAVEQVVPMAIRIANDCDRLKQLSRNIRTLAFKNSAEIIAGEVVKLAIQYRNQHEH